MTLRVLILQWIACLLLASISGVSSADNPILLSKSFGGIRGTKFSDKASVTAGEVVESVTIYAGERAVYGISLNVTRPTPTSLRHGKPSGTKSELVLAAKEYITSMEAHWGSALNRTHIVYLRFNTSDGNSISVGTKAKSRNTVRAPKGFQLGGFFGLSGKTIVKLGAIWTRISAKAATSSRLATSTTSDASESSSAVVTDGSKSSSASELASLAASNSASASESSDVSESSSATLSGESSRSKASSSSELASIAASSSTPNSESSDVSESSSGPLSDESSGLKSSSTSELASNADSDSSAESASEATSASESSSTAVADESKSSSSTELASLAASNSAPTSETGSGDFESQSTDISASADAAVVSMGGSATSSTAASLAESKEGSGEAPAQDPVQLSESFGGPHGKEFSDQASVVAGQTIGSITIRAGERVDGISLEVAGPKAITFNHGGAGGKENTLKLAKDEFITTMEVHWAEKKGRTRIFYLSFGTSAGNTVSAGSQTESKNTVTAPEGFQLGGFFGQDGDEIDKLGAIWTRISAEAPATEAPAPASAAASGSGVPAAESTSGSATDSALASTDSAGSEAPTTKKRKRTVDASAVGSIDDSFGASGSAEAPAAKASAASTDDSGVGSTKSSAEGSGAEPAMTIEDSIQLSERFGGPHGTNFSDQNFVNSGQTVSSISIHAGERLDGITLEISAPKTFTFTHGGTGGDQKTLKLEKDEYITSMEVHWSKHTAGTIVTKDKTRIFYVKFLTNLGNSLAGGSTTEQKTTVTAPKGFQLAGFFGSEGKEIDSLGAIWAYIELVKPPPTSAPALTPAAPSGGSMESSGSGNMTILIPKNTQPVQLSESFGGPHGKQFSDQLAVSSGMTITSVTLRAGERLDGMTVEVSAPKKMTFTHGGRGGKEDTLVLEAGEYITSFEAHLGKKRGATRVFYLSLKTSNGRSISGGTQTEIKGSAEAPEGFQLAGFFGRFGDEIDLIGAVWASIAAVNETVAGPVSADEDIVLSEPYGGPHGNAFSDIPKLTLGQSLASITLRGEERLDAVTIQVLEPQGLIYNHGGPGGKDSTLVFEAGEYVNSMEVHWCKNDGRTQVCYVNFGTSEGKNVSVGTKTQQSATAVAPKGFQLSGLFGRSEDEVYQLGAIWTRIEAKPLLLTDTMDTAWHGDIIRNWVGPTIGVPKDNACYRKTQPMDSKNVCPLGYGRDDDDCIVQCPMSYPVECFLECIPQNDDCALAVLTKIAAVANVAFNAATAGVLGNLKTVYTGATRIYMCAATVISVIKSLIYYFRFVQNTAPQGDTEQLLAVAYQSNVVLIDLPVAIYACLGKAPPPRMVWSGYVLQVVQFIVKQTIINGDMIISSATNVINLLKNATSVNSTANSVTELEDFIAANTSCGYELKKLTDRVIFRVSDVRNKTPNAAVDDIRVTISRSTLVQHDIPRVTNNCMKEMMVNKTKQAAFETRDLLRKTMGVIIDQLVEKSKTDMGKDVAENEYMKEVANMGLAVLGGLDPTGIFWMVSQFVQPICVPTSFIGEIDDGNLYDALGMWTVDEAFVGSYGSWTKKGDGVVSLIFESTDKEDVTVVIYSGGDEYAKVDVGAGDTVRWSSTVSELQAKTLYLDRWRPGLFGLPGRGGGSLLLWVPQAAQGGHLLMHVRINVS
ncbi:hypothetical protein F441_07818 [Phytophthora nicotianae CJ01A1]|uniref:Jacalin-type lectin domain-containing protein n=1 Tax=Phytophthora nicotianae CJ01A1 TaxID=1317063 RepID=W2X4W3_PHYNI|nr:hypothetical protein F441_07818 [Phytophthora nicotianae CJ01A1]